MAITSCNSSRHCRIFQGATSSVAASERIKVGWRHGQRNATLIKMKIDTRGKISTPLFLPGERDDLGMLFHETRKLLLHVAESEAGLRSCHFSSNVKHNLRSKHVQVVNILSLICVSSTTRRWMRGYRWALPSAMHPTPSLASL